MSMWKSSLFSCFDDLGLCIITYLVPCYTFGKNAEAMGENCLCCGEYTCLQSTNTTCIFYPVNFRGGCRISCQKGTHYVGPIAPNCPPCWSYLISVVQVHTTTYCIFHREQHWALHLLRPTLVMNIWFQSSPEQRPVGKAKIICYQTM